MSAFFEPMIRLKAVGLNHNDNSILVWVCSDPLSSQSLSFSLPSSSWNSSLNKWLFYHHCRQKPTQWCPYGTWYKAEKKCLLLSLKSGSWHLGYNLPHVNSEDPNLGPLRAGTAYNLQVFLCALSWVNALSSQCVELNHHWGRMHFLTLNF